MSRSYIILFYLLFLIQLSSPCLSFPVFGDKGIECKLITFDQDTISGYMKKSSRNNFYEGIKFRNTGQKKYSIYKPGEIHSVLTSKITLYSYKININNVDKYLFIRKAYEGAIDFYYSRIKNNSDLINEDEKAYFVGLDGNKIYQLRKRRLVETLLVLFKQCEEIITQLDETKFDYYYYNYNKLYKLVVNYNNCCKVPALPEKRNRKSDSKRVMYSIQ